MRRKPKPFQTLYGKAGGGSIGRLASYDPRKKRTYLGHTITGNSYDGYHAYAMGNDLYSKTIEGIKDQIHRAERGLPRHTSAYLKQRRRRNPVSHKAGIGSLVLVIGGIWLLMRLNR